MIKELQGLIQIPSVTAAQTDAEKPFGDVVPKALEYVLKLCDSYGFRTKNCEGFVGWAEIGQGEELMGILCHLDVVPAGTGWTYPPFAGEVHDGKLYGRGAVDDKGPAMAAIFAMKEILDSGMKLNKRIRIIFGQTEEDGDWIDMEYYKEHEEIPSFGFTPDADFPAIYGEKGLAQFILSMDAEKSGFIAAEGGEAPNMVPDRASCQVMCGGEKKSFTAEGKSAHASLLWEGENALTKLMEEVEASGADCPFARFYMEKIGRSLYGEQIGLDLADEASGKLTFNAGKLALSADKLELSVDIRYPVTCTYEEVKRRLAEAVAPYGLEVNLLAEMKPVYMDKDGPVIKKLIAAYREVTGDDSQPTVIGGGTYARAMDNIVAFGPVFPGRECTEHQSDEYILIEDLEKAKEIYKLAIIKLAGEQIG